MNFLLSLGHTVSHDTASGRELSAWGFRRWFTRAFPAETYELSEAQLTVWLENKEHTVHSCIHGLWLVSIVLAVCFRMLTVSCVFQVCSRPSWIWRVMRWSAVMQPVETLNLKFTVNWSNMFQDDGSRTHTARNVTPTPSCPKVQNQNHSHFWPYTMSDFLSVVPFISVQSTAWQYLQYFTAVSSSSTRSTNSNCVLFRTSSDHKRHWWDESVVAKSEYQERTTVSLDYHHTGPQTGNTHTHTHLSRCSGNTPVEAH